MHMFSPYPFFPASFQYLQTQLLCFPNSGLNIHVVTYRNSNPRNHATVVSSLYFSTIHGYSARVWIPLPPWRRRLFMWLSSGWRNVNRNDVWGSVTTFINKAAHITVSHVDMVLESQQNTDQTRQDGEQPHKKNLGPGRIRWRHSPQLPSPTFVVDEREKWNLDCAWSIVL